MWGGGGGGHSDSAKKALANKGMHPLMEWVHAARNVSTTLHGLMLYSSIVDVWKQTFNFPMEMTYP